MATATTTQTPPNCACGHGKMLLLCAGDLATYPGRYYYKCPVDGKHRKKFIWADECISIAGNNTFQSTNTETASSNSMSSDHHFSNLHNVVRQRGRGGSTIDNYGAHNNPVHNETLEMAYNGHQSLKKWLSQLQ